MEKKMENKFKGGYMLGLYRDVTDFNEVTMMLICGSL